MTHARVLATRLADLLSHEHAAMADFLIALADFDRYKSWVELGYASLFHFLHRDLGLSKGAAYYRKTAAELIQRFPEVIEPIRDGRLCITSVVHLAKVLTSENRDEVLPQFFQRSKQEAMRVAAAIRPADVVPRREVVTSVRSGAAVTQPEPTAIGDAAAEVPPVEPARPSDVGAGGVVQPVELPPSPDVGADTNAVTRSKGSCDSAMAVPQAVIVARRDSTEPLTRELSRLHITVSERFLQKLEAARAALSHERPRATAEAILETGLDLILERQAKRRAFVDRPRERSATAKPDHVPARVKREVWKRDRGCCQWPLEAGGICGSTFQAQVDHIIPRALGGPSTVKNMRVLCRVHNELAARLIFGDAWMDQFSRGGAKQEPSSSIELSSR